MKGIITDYIEEKGFGFIKDENEENRFFHISSIRNKNEFLNNITEYLYTEWMERKCYVVTFNPGENDKGLNASNINLTKQIFNDKSIVNVFDAKIVDLKYDTASLTRTVSGIKKGASAPFGATAGGNGTYRVGYPEVLRELNIYFRRVNDIGWGTIDVRDLALNINHRSNITDKFTDTLKNKIVGQLVKVILNQNDWTLVDSSILEI